MGPPVGQALEFLSQVLSQRGPQAVPYAENVKWNIREHMSDLLKMFPTLTISASEFHTNDGRVLNLLKAQGTVPVHFQGVKYNIPVIVWLPERYPVHAPLVYVTPTPNMVIKHNHSCVDASGQVRTPCINNWLYPSSDLSTMAQEMCMVFGAEPPLYSKPAGYAPPPLRPAQQHMQQNLLQATSGASGSSQMTQQQQQQAAVRPPGYPPPQGYPQQQQQQPPQQQPPPQQPQQPPPPPQQQQQPPQQQYPPAGPMGFGAALWGGVFGQSRPAAAAPAPGGGGGGGPPSSGQWPPPAAAQPGAAQPGGGNGGGASGGGGSPARPARPGPQQELEGEFAGLAARALQARLQAGLEAFNREAAREMDSLLEVQRQLRGREAELQRLVGSVQQERAGTEGVVAELGAKCSQLEKWLEDNEWKAEAVAGKAGAVATGKGHKGRADADAAAALLSKLDVSKVVVPSDDLCRQALAAQGEDLALEDALTVLDKALQRGKVAADAYIKQSRNLCRRQFFARARGLKIAQLQQQAAARQPRGAQGPPQAPGHPLVQGDGWSAPSPVAALGVPGHRYPTRI